MMEAVLPRSWKEQFALAASIREEDIKVRERLVRFEARQRQITEEQRIAAQKRDAEFSALIESVLATPARIAQFHETLDSYDAKTVEFLMENGDALERVRERIRQTLDQAHQLPDGTRVFKTEDGQRVFDEHGAQLGEDVIAPDMIPDHKVRWEAMKADRDEARVRAEHQTQAEAFLEKTGEARQRSKAGDLTEIELDRIERDLQRDMPDVLRAKLGVEKPDAGKPQGPSADGPLVLDDMGIQLRQAGNGPSPLNGPRL